MNHLLLVVTIYEYYLQEFGLFVNDSHCAHNYIDRIDSIYSMKESLISGIKVLI